MDMSFNNSIAAYEKNVKENKGFFGIWQLKYLQKTVIQSDVSLYPLKNTANLNEEELKYEQFHF